MKLGWNLLKRVRTAGVEERGTYLASYEIQA